MAESTHKLASESVEQVMERLESNIWLALTAPFATTESKQRNIEDNIRAAYLAGQQAERERCANLAAQHSYPAAGGTIAAAIRRGE